MRTDSGKSSTKVLHRQAHIMIKSDDGLFHLRCFVRLPYTLNVLVLVTGLDLRSLFLSKNRRCMFLVPAALLLVFLSFCYLFLLDLLFVFILFILFRLFCIKCNLFIPAAIPTNSMCYNVRGQCPCLSKCRMTSIFRSLIISSRKKSNLAGSISRHIE